MSTFWARCLAKVSGRMTAGVGNRLMRGRSVLVGAAARPGGGPGPPPAVPGSAPCSGAEALAGCQVPRALPPQVDVGGAGADPYPWPAPPPLIWPPASSWVSRVSCRWPPCPCCNAAGQGGAEEAVTPTGVWETLHPVPFLWGVGSSGPFGQELMRRGGVCFSQDVLGWFPWEQERM